MSKIKGSSFILRTAAFSLALFALLGGDPSAKVVQATPVIPVPNLAAYWNLDETSGPNAYDSAGTNNGTYYNAPVPSTDVPPVPAGNARSLLFVASGGTQRVAVPDSASLRISGPITVAAWVKPTADTPNYQKGVVSKFNLSPGIDGYWLELGWSNQGNNVPSFTLGNGTATAAAATGTALPLNQWTHIAGVYDGSNVMIYVNGTMLGSASNSGAGAILPTAANTSELHIGSDYGINVFTGNIDEVRIYSRGLNAGDLNVLTTMVQPPATGLVATGGTNQIALNWTAASNATSANVVYSILRGPSTGNYTTVINTVSGTTYTDTSATAGTPYFYAVVAVSSIAGAASNESSATASAGPPPPPPGPRAPKGPDSHNRCGCATAMPAGRSVPVAGAALVAALLLALLRRR
jgi:MYXO-CTERM domain-containing protein